MTYSKRALIFIVILLFSVFARTAVAYATDDILSIPDISVNIGGGTEDGGNAASSSVQLLFLLAVISLAPSLIIMLTSFTRIIIVLHFVRSALGTQQMPPNQVLIGLALFLTLFAMRPVIAEVNTNAIQPYSRGEISQMQMVDAAMAPIREFMFSQAEDKDIALFIELSQEEYASREDIPNSVIIPAFIIGEMTKGFIFGFIIYVPFIVIDMVVASVLMAMGMMMLPPAMISLPFKILLFVMVDGWAYIVEVLMVTFFSS